MGECSNMFYNRISFINYLGSMSVWGIVGYCVYITWWCITLYLQSQWYWYDKMWILAFLLLTDTITGVYKSYALWSVSNKEYYPDWKEKNTWFNSTVLKVWLIWKFITLILPVVILSFVYLVWYDVSSLATIWFSLIGGAEVISIIQNFIIAKTKKPMQEFDAITFVMQGILNIVKLWIEKSLTTSKYKNEDQ